MAKVSQPKGIERAAQRVLRAAENLEKVIIFGDADLDGIAAVVILKELFEILNPLYKQDETLKVYFPNRETEGYGISIACLDFFASDAPALLFALDCGISNFEEVKKAKKMGFEVVIIDHHQTIGRLPKADIIVDPKQKTETYHFKDFAAAGLVYKLAEAVISEIKQPEIIKEKFLELAALATIADQMPLKEDNDQIVNKGLAALSSTDRQGLLALIKLGDADTQIDVDIFQKIIAPLNSSRLRNHVAESYLLLTESSPKKAEILARNLIRQSEQKKLEISFALDEIGRKIDQQKGDFLVIFEASKAWQVSALGVLASKLLHKYKKPVFLFKTGEKESVGSARLPRDLDGVKAMASCKKLLETYGGHAPACGCRLKNKNLDKFKVCLEKYFLCKK